MRSGTGSAALTVALDLGQGTGPPGSRSRLKAPQRVAHSSAELRTAAGGCCRVVIRAWFDVECDMADSAARSSVSRGSLTRALPSGRRSKRTARGGHLPHVGGEPQGAPMISGDRARQLALALPEAVEKDHHGRPSFRVADKIFATQWDKDHVNVMLDESGILSAVRAAPETCGEVWWGKRLAAVRVDLSASTQRRLLISCWTPGSARPPDAFTKDDSTTRGAWPCTGPQ